MDKIELLSILNGKVTLTVYVVDAPLIRLDGTIDKLKKEAALVIAIAVAVQDYITTKVLVKSDIV
jgi:hypothetical protein